MSAAGSRWVFTVVIMRASITFDRYEVLIEESLSGFGIGMEIEGRTPAPTSKGQGSG